MNVNLIKIIGLWSIFLNFIKASQPTHTNNWAVIGKFFIIYLSTSFILYNLLLFVLSGYIKVLVQL